MNKAKYKFKFSADELNGYRIFKKAVIFMVSKGEEEEWDHHISGRHDPQKDERATHWIPSHEEGYRLYGLCLGTLRARVV
jgi:hypothetical protein